MQGAQEREAVEELVRAREDWDSVRAQMDEAARAGDMARVRALQEKLKAVEGRLSEIKSKVGADRNQRGITPCIPEGSTPRITTADASKRDTVRAVPVGQQGVVGQTTTSADCGQVKSN